MTDDRYGNINVDRSDYKTDPVKAYLQEKKEKKSQGTYNTWVRILKENGNGTGYQQILDEIGTTVLEASVTDVEHYLATLEDAGFRDSGINVYLTNIATFYNDLREYGIHDANPAAYVLDEQDYDIDSPDRDYHSVSEMADFIGSIPDPQMRTAALLLVKTGMRRGELVNLDLSTVHIDDDRYREDYLDHYGISLVDAIKDRPDSLYIDAEINEGQVFRGEERADGNKRVRNTVVPIDAELKRSLIDWLSIRPETPDPPYPLFTTEETMNGDFKRIRGQQVYSNLIENYAREQGLAEVGDNHEDVDVHYFRHFFTTQMTRTRGDHDGSLEPSLIKYVRGDKIDDDILDIYSHDSWGVNVREEYLENIYELGVYDG